MTSAEPPDRPRADDPRLVELLALRYLYEGLLAECDAMLGWATDRGLSPAPQTLRQLTYARQVLSDMPRPRADRPRHADEKAPGLDPLPFGIVAETGPSLMALHGELSRLVHPARPQTIARMAEEARTRPRAVQWFGPLPIVRRLVVASLVLLAAFVLFASSESVRQSTGDGDRDQTTSTTADGG